MTRLKIPLSGLEPGRNPVEIEADPEVLDLKPWLSFRTPLAIRGSIDKFGETLTLRAQAIAEVEETCGRCTKPFTRPLDVELLVFSDRRGSDDEATSRELEREGQLVYHDGTSLDITDTVREAVILSLPISPLCREDCRGLCPGCGQDLNEEACRCSGEKPDPRWSALKGLKDLS
jgi:uncharacterized protein